MPSFLAQCSENVLWANTDDWKLCVFGRIAWHFEMRHRIINQWVKGKTRNCWAKHNCTIDCSICSEKDHCSEALKCPSVRAVSVCEDSCFQLDHLNHPRRQKNLAISKILFWEEPILKGFYVAGKSNLIEASTSSELGHKQKRYSYWFYIYQCCGCAHIHTTNV